MEKGARERTPKEKGAEGLSVGAGVVVAGTDFRSRLCHRMAG